MDHAVVVGGGYAPPGFASQITAEALAEATATKLGSQVYLAQNLLPLVAPTGTYNVVTGLLGEAPEWAPYQARGTGESTRANIPPARGALTVGAPCPRRRIAPPPRPPRRPPLLAGADGYL